MSEKKHNSKANFFKKHKVWSIIIIIIAVLLIVAACCFGFLYSKLSLLNRDNQSSSLTAQTSSNDDDTDVDTEGLDPSKIIEAEGEIFKDENVFNIMLIGSDERTKDFSDSARGDTCMILSINKTTGETKLVSFERGTGVKILDGEYKGQYDWLTHTFAYGGADLMMEEVRESYKVDVTHYIRTNIYTFMELIDSVGGVDISLTQAEADYINHPEGTYANGHINEMNVADKIQTVKVGENHLNGATAMLYARCRCIDSDWNRVERQRNVIKACANNLKNENLVELNSTFNTVLPLVQTNLTNSEILSLLTLIPKYNNIGDQTLTMPQKGTYGSMVGMGGRHMFAPDYQENSEILKKFLYDVD